MRANDIYFFISFLLNLATILWSSPVNRYRITEECRAGTVVANLTHDLLLDKESRRYLGITNWKDSGPRHFEINNTTGLLYVKTPPDRELLCNKMPVCKIILSIAYGNRYDPTIVSVSIELKDINDHAPKFPRNEIQLDVVENTKPHQNIFDLLAARDPDFEENGTISYSLNNPQKAPFKLESRPGDPPRLQLTAPVDWEKKNRYLMRVLAKDNGSPPKTGTLTVHVMVKDDNDHAPKFTKPNYDVTVKENVAKNAKILELYAEDKDSESNGIVTYSIAPSTTAMEIEAARYFGIQTLGKVGHLYVREKLDIDRRESRQFRLTIEATDNGTPRKSSKAKVIIRVEDINDYTPEISISYMNEDYLDKNKGYVMENIERSFIGQVSVKDYDGGAGGEVQCRTTDNRFRLEDMNRNEVGRQKEFKLMSSTKFDREVTSQINFQIICIDNVNRINNEIQLTGQTSVMVVVRDENDEAPVFSKQMYTFYVKENVPTKGSRGLQVGRVFAEDKDLKINGQISYDLLTNPSNDFKIDQSGIIYLLHPFDRESTPDVNFTVKASDKIFSSTVPVRVVITDVNDSPPVFLRSEYSFDVPENSRNASVGQVKAEDYDQDKNITYHIEYSKNMFSINPRTGQIWVNRALDRELEERYVFHVLAVDRPTSGSPYASRNTGTATVTVKVLDMNDNSPVINYPTTHSPISVEEGSPAGHNLFTISALDRDIGENGTVQYHILKGDSGVFGIDSGTGIVFLTSKLVEATKDYLLVLRAEDKGRPYSRNASVAVKIRVKPKSNLPDQGNYSGELNSTLANRTIIIILSTIFVILLLTTLILAFLIKRRRDTERRKFRGKCQYGKNSASQELSSKGLGGEKLRDEGKLTIPRGDYQGVYSPLRTTFNPLLVSQEEGPSGTLSGSGEGKGSGVVFWCKAPSTVKLPDCTTLPGDLSGQLPQRTYSSDYQTLDANFANKSDMAHLYYEINNRQRAPASFQLHTSAEGLPYHSLYRGVDPKTSLHYHQEEGVPLRLTGAEEEGDMSSTGDSGASGGTGENPWSSINEGKGSSGQIVPMTSTNRMNTQTRTKAQTTYSPYAEASFV